MCSFTAVHGGLVKYVQLTVEQHRFEMRESTYTGIFFNSKVYYSAA